MPGPLIAAFLKAKAAQKLTKRKKKLGGAKERFGMLKQGDVGGALIGAENKNLLADVLKKKKKKKPILVR